MSWRAFKLGQSRSFECQSQGGQILKAGSEAFLLECFAYAFCYAPVLPVFRRANGSRARRRTFGQKISHDGGGIGGITIL